MTKLLNEQQENQVKRDTMFMLQSPIGRAWGRAILAERGKGDGANYVQIKRELLDIVNECLDSLYAADAPKMSR